MLDFLDDGYRSWPDIVDDDEGSQFRGPTDDLSYAHAKHQVGFDYVAGGGADREYAYAVVRWMAFHVGRRKRRFKVGVLPRPAPYYVYDGLESIPILLNTEWIPAPTGFEPFVVDRYGLPIDDTIARNLAWFHIPEGTYERVSATHRGQPTKAIREALIESGIERARTVLQFIRAEIARLDTQWATYNV